MKKYAITVVITPRNVTGDGNERIYYIAKDGALKFPENIAEEDLFDTHEEAKAAAVKYADADQATPVHQYTYQIVEFTVK